jgi:hypothetical protein
MLDGSCYATTLQNTNSTNCPNGKYNVGILNNSTNTIISMMRCVDILSSTYMSSSSASNNGTLLDNCWNTIYGGQFNTTVDTIYNTTCVNATTLSTIACKCTDGDCRKVTTTTNVEDIIYQQSGYYTAFIKYNNTGYDCNCTLLDNCFAGLYQYILVNAPPTSIYSFNQQGFSFTINNNA